MKIIEAVFGKKCTVCNNSHTKRKDADGNVVCFQCQLIRKIEEEPKLICPKCKTPMDKEYVEKTIIDKCYNCGGVFLDNKEMYGFLYDALTPRGA